MYRQSRISRVVMTMIAICIGGIAEAHEWSGWSKIPGGALTDVPVTPVQRHADLFVFHKGTSGGVFYQVWNGSSWGAVNRVPGGGVTDAAVGASFDGSYLYLFLKGVGDKNTYLTTLGNDDRWSSLSPVLTKWRRTAWRTDRGLAAATQPVVPGVNTVPITYVFGRRLEDGGIYNNAKPLFGSWSGWGRIDGTFTAGGGVGGPAASATWNPTLGRLEVYATRASDGAICMSAQAPGKTWTTFAEIGGGGRTNAAPAAAWDDSAFGLDSTHAFVKGISHQGVFVNTQTSPTAWAGWIEVIGSGTTDAAPAVTRYDGHGANQLMLFVKGEAPNNEIWLNTGR